MSVTILEQFDTNAPSTWKGEHTVPLNKILLKIKTGMKKKE